MAIGILILGSINAAKFAIFGLLIGLILVLFLHELIKKTAHRVLFVTACTLCTASVGFINIFNAALDAMG